MNWPYDDIPDWEKAERSAYRYNMEASRRQGCDGEKPLPQLRAFTDEEHRASTERLLEYQAERAREQLAAYRARKAESLARDSSGRGPAIS